MSKATCDHTYFRDGCPPCEAEQTSPLCERCGGFATRAPLCASCAHFLGVAAWGRIKEMDRWVSRRDSTPNPDNSAQQRHEDQFAYEQFQQARGE